MTHTEAQRHRGKEVMPKSFPISLRASAPPRDISVWLYLCCLLCASVPLCAISLQAQEPAKPDVPSVGSSADQLALEQSRVADKYAKLEQLMLKMSELEGLTNPKRAQ